MGVSGNRIIYIYILPVRASGVGRSTLYFFRTGHERMLLRYMKYSLKGLLSGPPNVSYVGNDLPASLRVLDAPLSPQHKRPGSKVMA